MAIIFKQLKSNKGMSLIEISVVILIFTFALVGLLSLIIFSLNTITQKKQSVEAIMIAQETIEAVRNFRDNTIWDIDGIGTLTSGNNYFPELDSSTGTTTWTMTLGTETIGIFTRDVIFNNVSRDPTSKDIESTYNAINDDPDTRKATAVVSWGSRNFRIISYITNWQ